jgi:hypothetical protein
MILRGPSSSFFLIFNEGQALSVFLIGIPSIQLSCVKLSPYSKTCASRNNDQ